MKNFCNHPDRHEPKLKCGYPLPCPYHTVIIDPPNIYNVPPGVPRETFEKLEIIAEIFEEDQNELLKKPEG